MKNKERDENLFRLATGIIDKWWDKLEELLDEIECEFKNEMEGMSRDELRRLIILITADKKELVKANKFSKRLEGIAKKYAREAAQLDNILKSQKAIPNIRNNKSKSGRKPKFNSESELHNAIEEIPNWKNLSPEKISLELGFSKSWLRAFINDEKRNWSLPKN